MARTLAAALAIAATLIASGCEKDKKEGGSSADASPTSVPSAARSSAAVQGLPGCNLVTPHGSVLPKLGTGALSFASAKGKALLVVTAPGGARADRVVLGPTGAPEGSAEPIDDVLPKGTEAITFASAMAFDGELSSLAFAFGAHSPTPSQCSDGVFVMKRSGASGARRDLTHACRTTTMLRGAARRQLGIAILDGPAIADAWILDRGETRSIHLETLQPASAVIDYVAVAAGASSLAAAWVVKDGQKRELHAARMGRTGERIGAVSVLDKSADTVAMAFEGDTLHVVWSSLVAERNRSVLKWTKWSADGAPAASQEIGTGVLSATAPSLAIDDGRFFVAWRENGALPEVRASALKCQ